MVQMRATQSSGPRADLMSVWLCVEFYPSGPAYDPPLGSPMNRWPLGWLDLETCDQGASAQNVPVVPELSPNRAVEGRKVVV